MLERWYVDWQELEHARLFDGRHRLSKRDLARNYRSFNDVRLLEERLDRTRSLKFLEVGCATGEFYRYLRTQYPQIGYYGVDVSRPAVARAKEKYPKGNFFVTDPGLPVADNLRMLGIPASPDIVYAKDVLHHQTDPHAFLLQLLTIASGAVILRTRTRDIGQTVADPELSCQYHYKGWMPYIVLNLQELIKSVQTQAPRCELIIYRNHMILGGWENRFLPKECYLPETGTAETAMGVFLETENPGRVHVEDRKDQDLVYSSGYRFKNLICRALRQIQ